MGACPQEILKFKYFEIESLNTLRLNLRAGEDLK